MIVCTNFTPYKKNSLQGFADLHMRKWGVIISGFCLHETNGKRWITMPAREYKKEDGTKAFAPIIHFMRKDHFSAFCEKAKEAIDKFREEKGDGLEIRD